MREDKEYIDANWPTSDQELEKVCARYVKEHGYGQTRSAVIRPSLLVFATRRSIGELFGDRLHA